MKLQNIYPSYSGLQLVRAKKRIRWAYVFEALVTKSRRRGILLIIAGGFIAALIFLPKPVLADYTGAWCCRGTAVGCESVWYESYNEEPLRFSSCDTGWWQLENCSIPGPSCSWGTCSKSCDGGKQNYVCTNVCGASWNSGSPRDCNTQACCTPSCSNKVCGSSNGCSGTCAPGSGCCSTINVSGSFSGLPAGATVKVCIQGTGTCSAASATSYTLTVPVAGATLVTQAVTGSYASVTPNSYAIGAAASCSNLANKDFTFTPPCVSDGQCHPANSCSAEYCGTGTCLDNCNRSIACTGPQGSSCGTVVTGNGPGVVYYAGTVNSGTGQISRKSGGGNLNWKVNSTFNTSLLNQYKVDPYWASFITNHNASRLGGMGVGDAVLNNGNDLENKMTQDVNYLFTTNGLKINATQLLTSGRSAIILVNGDLTITGGVTRTNKGSFVAFFVKGSINVDNGLTNGTNPLLDGVFVTDGVFNTGTSPNKTEKFIGNGIFIAYGGFTLQRDLGNTTNQTQPAETFTFDPSLVLNAPSDLSRSNYTWREVAP